jgi:hypothetical protein
MTCATCLSGAEVIPAVNADSGFEVVSSIARSMSLIRHRHHVQARVQPPAIGTQDRGRHPPRRDIAERAANSDRLMETGLADRLRELALGGRRRRAAAGRHRWAVHDRRLVEPV